MIVVVMYQSSCICFILLVVSVMLNCDYYVVCVAPTGVTFEPP